jgi:hypothetical protein
LEKFLAESNKKLSKTFDITDGQSKYGTAKFQMEVDCTGVIAKSGFELMVGYDNRGCKKSVKKIEVKVIEKTGIKPKDNSKELTHEKLVGKWKLPGIPKDESRFYCNHLEFTKDSINKLETVQGNSFNRSYKLIVEAIYSSWKKNNPKLQFDLNITGYYESTDPNNLLRDQEEEKKEKVVKEEVQLVEMPQIEQEVLQVQPALQPILPIVPDIQPIMPELQPILPEPNILAMLEEVKRQPMVAELLLPLMPEAPAIIPEQPIEVLSVLQPIPPQVIEQDFIPLADLEPSLHKFPINQPLMEDEKRLVPPVMVNLYNARRDSEKSDEERKVPVLADSYEPARYRAPELIPILANSFEPIGHREEIQEPSENLLIPVPVYDIAKSDANSELLVPQLTEEELIVPILDGKYSFGEDGIQEDDKKVIRHGNEEESDEVKNLDEEEDIKSSVNNEEDQSSHNAQLNHTKKMKKSGDEMAQGSEELKNGSDAKENKNIDEEHNSSNDSEEKKQYEVAESNSEEVSQSTEVTFQANIILHQLNQEPLLQPQSNFN